MQGALSASSVAFKRADLVSMVGGTVPCSVVLLGGGSTLRAAGRWRRRGSCTACPGAAVAVGGAEAPLPRSCVEEPPHAARVGTSTRAAAAAASRVSTASIVGGTLVTGAEPAARSRRPPAGSDLLDSGHGNDLARGQPRPDRRRAARPGQPRAVVHPHRRATSTDFTSETPRGLPGGPQHLPEHRHRRLRRLGAPVQRARGRPRQHRGRLCVGRPAVRAPPLLRGRGHRATSSSARRSAAASAPTTA